MDQAYNRTSVPIHFLVMAVFPIARKALTLSASLLSQKVLSASHTLLVPLYKKSTVLPFHVFYLCVKNEYQTEQEYDNFKTTYP